MLPTEVQRILLLIGLAATGYLMILAWNDDFILSQKTPTEYGAAPEPESGTEAPALDTAGGPAAGDSDVPDASLIGPSAAEHPPVPAAAQPVAERLIRVETPELKVWIDRRGGDIVRVELPAYPVSIEEPDVPYLLLDHGRGRTYIAQSGLIGADGVDAGGERPLYDAAASDYRMTDGEPLEVELSANVDGQTVTKRFEFRPGDYLVDVSYEVENHGTRPIQASVFAQIKRDDGVPPGSNSFALGPRPYLGGALTTPDSRYEKLKFDELDEDGTYRVTVDGGWIAFLQHYFLSAWVAEPDVQNNFYGQKRRDGTYVFGYTGPLKTVAPGGRGSWHSRFYAGPKDQKRLEQIAPNLNLTVDYGFLWWLAVPLFYVLDWLHGFVGNWGVAIILLTVLVKGVLFPLSAASYRSMANMRRVAPQMKRLQERYADDRQKLSQEMMSLYKKEQVNPLGGCLPMILPMPVFIALYWVLFETVELRQAPFFLWIQDLSVMDPFFVLPLLMGGSMYLTQLMSPAVGDPMQVRMMKLMPIMFTVLFLFFPAGLVLYWLVNNVLGVAQQYYVIKQTERADAARA
ncbi:MAG: membrane protein insertase YidC [Pseudomonadales bacterium]|jgi:YidC/Oxa1 family membrane protein insertase